MNPRDLSAQAASCRHLLPYAESDEIRACVEHAIKTIEWMQKGELVLKELMRLRKEEPELFETLRELIGIGASIADIRSTDRMTQEAGL